MESSAFSRNATVAVILESSDIAITFEIQINVYATLWAKIVTRVINENDVITKNTNEQMFVVIANLFSARGKRESIMKGFGTWIYELM